MSQQYEVPIAVSCQQVVLFRWKAVRSCWPSPPLSGWSPLRCCSPAGLWFT